MTLVVILSYHFYDNAYDIIYDKMCDIAYDIKHDVIIDIVCINIWRYKIIYDIKA
jgi:hypothetical protein